MYSEQKSMEMKIESGGDREEPFYHTNKTEWLITPDGKPRGYIQPQLLREVWFHTGTICNLECSFCLEGSKPGDNRIESLRLSDAKPFIDEALNFDVKQFCFTGGEPFVIADIINILDYALQLRPCLVLTNGTDPLQKRISDILPLQKQKNQLHFRISLDYPDAEKHDIERGSGNFHKALQSMALLHEHGFGVSIARRSECGENKAQVHQAYKSHFMNTGLPTGLNIVTFPELFTPGAAVATPHITENCMTTYKDKSSRESFMCNYSKMVLKKNGKMAVYPCTLVDDDYDYALGSTLAEAMKYRVMLKHQRCYACFSEGASCSEFH